MTKAIPIRERLAVSIDQRAFNLNGWAYTVEAEQERMECVSVAFRAADAMLAEVKANALLAAAATIPGQMQADELDLHDITYAAGLPGPSRIMLNGATRFAERLTKRAEKYRTEATE